MLAYSGTDAGVRTTTSEVGRVITPEGIQELSDLERGAMRDRAAYVHVTGCHPTHLRKMTQEWLNALTSFMAGGTPSGRAGTLVVNPDAAEILKLDDHPMVKKVHAFERCGYRIALPDAKRHRYSAVYMVGEVSGRVSRIIVQKDGSVIEGWA